MDGDLAAEAARRAARNSDGVALDHEVELVRHGLGSALLDVETDPPWRPPPGNEPPGWPPRAVRFEVRPDIVERAIALCPPDARADVVALAACLVGGRKDIAAKLDELAFPAADRQTVAHSANSAGYLVDVLEDAENDVGLWTALRKQPPETVALAGAYSDKAALAARRWLDDVRHRRLAITGDDIVAAGLSGPAVGQALDAAMVAMLRGDADSREEQLAAALG